MEDKCQVVNMDSEDRILKPLELCDHGLENLGVCVTWGICEGVQAASALPPFLGPHLPRPPPRHSNASSSLAPSRWQCMAGLGVREVVMGSAAKKTALPPPQPWLTAKGDTMSILVKIRAVAGPIGVHCLQGEQVLAPCSLGPVRWSRRVVHRGPAPTCNSRAGPSLLWPRVLGAAPSHMSRLGDAVLILQVC